MNAFDKTLLAATIGCLFATGAHAQGVTPKAGATAGATVSGSVTAGRTSADAKASVDTKADVNPVAADRASDRSAQDARDKCSHLTGMQMGKCISDERNKSAPGQVRSEAKADGSVETRRN